MKKSQKIILCSIFTGLQLFQPVSSYANLSSIDDKPMRNLASVLSKTTPSVVNVAVEKLIPQTPASWYPEADQNSGLTKVLGVGSGVIIDAKKGYIVTNAHVIKNQKIVMVTIKDDRRYRAKIIGKDEGFDLAVIQIHAQHLTELPIGNSDQLKVGDFAVAIGSPFGLTQTVTSGIISALNRQEPRINNFQSFIQTDAAINPGNSGGALMDLQGNLIGINTAIIVTPSSGNIGIGFAIPSNIVKSVAEQLIKYGQVKHGILGVTTQNITPELADAMKIKYNKGAVLVTGVISESPAAKAGVEVQDVIASVNGIRIHSSVQLHNMLGLVRPGTKIQLIVLRDHKIFKIKTRVANSKELLLQRGLPFLGGMRMQKFNDLEPDGTILQGMLVTSVDDNSDGALAGLEPGDIIISANGYSALTINDVIKVARSRPKELFLKVMRNSGQLFLVIPQSNS